MINNKVKYMIYKNFNIFYLTLTFLSGCDQSVITFDIYYLKGKFLRLINIPTFQYSNIPK